ncbi:MAG: helix-turn-helix domain-containing protein [bacterium]|nr:helix-turn-helix domain-containing protein [bacterium]
MRGVPVFERPSRVFEVLDRLPDGEPLTFVTDLEPRGLMSRIELSRKHEIVLDGRRIGEREWHVTLRRIEPEVDAPSPVGVLRRSAAFAELDDATRARIAASASMHTVRRGQALVTENSEWPFVGVVFEGVVAMSSGVGSSRNRIFYEIFPYEVFGEAEFFDHSLSVGRVVAISKVARVLRIPRDALSAVASDAPQTLVALGRIAAQRVRGLMHALSAQATLPIVARIASVLLPYAMPEDGLSQAVSPLPTMTQAQIAAAAGTVKEVAARAIAELENHAVLKRERGHIRYLDRQKLVDLIREHS